MIFERKRFYKDFLDSKEGMATNILSDRLKKLESNGIIASKVYEKLKTRKVYSLTKKGKDLIPVLVEVMVWSAKHHDELALPQEFLAKAIANREGVIAKIMSNLN